MGLSNITSREPVLAAIKEYDRIGREPFLQKYGFGGSRRYWLVRDGNRYDSKAVVGAAHGYARPDLGPMQAHDFSGGAATVKQRLEKLGFRVEVDGPSMPDGELTSERLTSGEIYSRAGLSRLFSIRDATIRTGVFRPKGTASVWLFVTENKPGDRTPYLDRLEGNTLHWQGQMAGRTDAWIIEHYARGLEILVFFRESKDEHPEYGFRYLGPFAYISHTGNRPTNFVLQRISSRIEAISWDAAEDDAFDPAGVDDARQRTMRSIAQRRGQKAFRQSLLRAYEGKCAITACSVRDVLEAAHIYPYRGPKTNHLTNGLLLRADIHTLFDCGLITIDPDSLTILIKKQLRDSNYWSYDNRTLRVPQNPAEQPSASALRMRLADYCTRNLGANGHNWQAGA